MRWESFGFSRRSDSTFASGGGGLGGKGKGEEGVKERGRRGTDSGLHDKLRGFLREKGEG